MKAVVERAALARALGEAARIVRARNTIPILANVRIEAKAGAVHLIATDLDLQIALPLAAQVTDEGGTTAPAHRLAGIVQSLPEGCQISLTAKDGKLAVVAGRSRFSLQTLPLDDFPVIGFGERDGVAFALTGSEVRRLFGVPRPAMLTEEIPYYKNGICLELASGKAWREEAGLHATATDGHRLVRTVVAPPEGLVMPAGGDRPIIQLRTTEAVVRLAEGADNVAVRLGTQKIEFDFGGASLIAKLVEGTFPDSDRVIPRNCDHFVRIDPELLCAAVKRVAQVSAEKTRGVKLVWGNDIVTISCASPEYGEASEDVPCAGQLDGFTIGVNGRYLVDIVSIYSGEVELGFGDAAAPILLRPPNVVESSSAAISIIMPMRI